MQMLSVVIAALLVSSPVVKARQTDEGFPDVPKSHWAYEAVTELKQKGILVGYPDTPQPAPKTRAADSTRRSAPTRSRDRQRPVNHRVRKR